MRRKFLSVVLCVCMMLTMAPFAFAAEGDGNEGTPTPYATDITDTGASTSTLQSQIDSASSGSTLTLNQDYTESKDNTITIPQDKSITLDLANHTLKGQLSVLGDLTIKNGTVKAYDNSAGIYAYGKLTLDSVTLTGAAKPLKDTDHTSLIYVCLGSNVTIDADSKVIATDTTAANPDPAIFIGNEHGSSSTSQTLNIYGEVSTAKAPSIQGNGTDRSVSHINIYDGAEVKSNKVAIFLPQPCEVNMTGGTVEGYCGIGMKSGTLNLSGGIVNGTSTDTDISDQYSKTNGISYDGSAILIDSYIGYAGQVKINISGDATVKSNYSTAIREIGNTASQTNVVSVTVTGGKVLSGASKDAIQMREASVSTVSLTGGTFSSDVSQYCEKNYYAEENEDSTYTVKSMKDIAVAQIGDTYYKTLADAVAAVQDGSTITLLKDTTGSGIGTYKTPGTDLNGNPQIAAKGFTIDFNHHTYSVDKPAVGSKRYETQGFHLEWKGSIDTTPNITLKNGTLDVAQNHDPNLKLLIQNYCNLTLDNMTVDGTNLTKGWASNGVPYTYVTSNCNGTVNIKDTTIISGNPAYDVAFDVDGARHSYGPVHLTIDENSRICGKFEVSAQKGNSLTINSGYFTSNPSDYLATGKGLVDSDLANYYEVGDSNVTVDTEVKAGDASVSIPEGSSITQDDVKNAAQSQATQESLTKAASGLTSNESIVGTANDAKKALGNKVQESQIVTVVVQPYLNVEVKELPTESNAQTMSVNISALYNVIATTNPDDISNSNSSVTMKEAQPMSVSTPVTIKLALPNGFANANDKLSIKHTKENGSVEYYTGIVSVDSGKTYVTFTTNGFSPFVISAPVASIGDDVYPSLQAAVDAVQNGQTIKLEKECAENATVSRVVNFTLNKGSKNFTGTISAGSRYSMTTADVEGNTKYTFTYVGGGSSSSGTPTTSYNVNVNAATNGTVAADKKTAAKGTTVTVTASPSKGYVVDAVKVVDKDGKDVAVTAKDGKYVFTMPASAVTVTGTFKAETPAPVALPFTDVKSGNWFYDAVKYAYAQGLMTGTSATTFAPNGTMNRAMIVTVLYRLEKSPAVTGASKFTDVPAGQWYSDAVAWAAANKIVNGYDETTFGPMNAVTREQMAAILFRYEQVKGLENVTLEENLNRFPDQNKISAYAIPALQWAVGQKIINGNADGTLDPTGTATRAQVAQIFTNLLNK
ncbi:MAG: S-layer homology domain-containing protein [Bacillota bacterium]|nr:S-layer homology domain-containing protein [Bacillota bacterium]